MYPAFNRSSQKPPLGINAPLDDRGRTALHLAVEKDDTNAVLRLLRLGANINQTDKQGQTPIFEAAAKRLDGMVDLLVSHNAQTQHRDTQGRSLTEWAIETGADAPFISMLGSYGAPFEPAQKTRRTPLHRAAEQGRTDLIEALVQQGLDPNARDSDGKTPLHLATAAGHVSAMQALIAQGANPTARDNDIVTPLHIAAEKGNLPVLDYLMTLHEVRISINQYAAYQTGFTPVMAAAAHNHTEVIERLVAHGADLNKTDNQNRHSLFIAVETGKVDAVRKLIALGADASRDVLSNSNKSPMMHWVNDNHYGEILGMIVGAGANINATDSNNQTALHRACDYMRHEQIKCLLQLGADANAVNNHGQRPIDELMDNYGYRNNDMPETIDALLRAGADAGISPSPLVQRAPLHIAAEAGHVQSVRMLIKKGAPVDVPERSSTHMTPLLMAAENGNLQIVEMLLEAHANIEKTDSEKRNALHLAAKSGHMHVCQYLLDKTSLHINTPDADGMTPLHHACAREKTLVIKMLIERGADIYAEDKNGDTPLHRAMKDRGDDTIDAYVQALGAAVDLDVLSARGRTPLMDAVETGFARSVEKLLAAGADVTRPGTDGKTALHIALEEQQTSLALTLIESLQQRGIHPDALVDNAGNTPLHLAAQKDMYSVIEKLIKRGADIDRPNADGNTPLHLASEKHNLSAVNLLVGAGAKTLVPNKAGETALDIVMKDEQGYLFDAMLPFALNEELEKSKEATPPAPQKPQDKQAPKAPKPPGL